MADQRLTRLVVSEPDLEDIGAALEKLLFDSHANSAIILDRSGQIITNKGKEQDCDLATLGALIAGTFASARELAKALKEVDFHVLFQQGSREHVLTTLVDEQWLLSVLFDQNAYLGLVKVLSKETAQELVAVLDRVRHNSREQEVPGRTDLLNSAERKIDALFRES